MSAQDLQSQDCFLKTLFVKDLLSVIARELAW